MTHSDESDLVAELTAAIKRAHNVVVFTGAGLSTESGIPDFRGPNGIWKTQTPIDFSDFVASEDWRRESWRRRFSGTDRFGTAEPNLGHLAIAHWVRSGKITSIITQNVDGLHQKSGVPDDQIIELHGNAQYATCLSCGDRYELAALRSLFLPDETVPVCRQCGGIIKTATISFGQSMPEQPMHRAQQAVVDCDLFIAIGSSLVVYPAADFPLRAKQQGAQLVIINREVTNCDRHADWVIHEEIGPLLSAVLGDD
jgi:NAD-dependent deacetylase